MMENADKRPDRASPTHEICDYLCKAIHAGQFTIPSEEVPKLQELVRELERRALGI